MNFLRLFTGHDVSGCEQKPVRVFLHIPKCGGTSLHKLLSGQFHASHICPVRHNCLDQLKPRDLARYRLFSGHYTYETVQRFVPEPRSVVTLLRHPVDRLLSSYYFGRSHSWSFIEQHPHFSDSPSAYRLHGMAYRPAKQMRLSDYLDAEGPHLAGMMVRWIGGEEGSPFTSLERAMERLNGMSAVGLVEQMSEGVHAICDAWGLPRPNAIPRELEQGKLSNTLSWIEKVEREPITLEIERKLHSICKLDMELFDYACELIRRRAPLATERPRLAA